MGDQLPRKEDLLNRKITDASKSLAKFFVPGGAEKRQDDRNRRPQKRSVLDCSLLAGNDIQNAIFVGL
jgi:hypothetical protein